MREQPVLSIITPTRGNFSDYWFQQLLSIKGDIQFVLVYPPDATVPSSDDPRVNLEAELR